MGPDIVLHLSCLLSATPSAGKHTAMLVCSAYNFYPKMIKVTWMRDEQEVTRSTSQHVWTEVLANSDWYYQMHSYLEYTPTPGENITCTVHHASFTEPKILHWGKITTTTTLP